MATEAENPLTKVDSAVSGVSPSSPTEEKKGHRRASSSAAGVYNIADLGKLDGPRHLTIVVLNSMVEKEGKELQIAKETQKLNWYVMLRLTTSSKPSLPQLSRSLKAMPKSIPISHQQATEIILNISIELIANISYFQETQHISLDPRRKGCPQENAHHPSGQENRSPLPTRPGGHGTEPEGSHHQRRTRCHLQTIQEKGISSPPLLKALTSFPTIPIHPTIVQASIVSL